MSVKTNISILNNCYGCGVCATSCPQNIINIKENVDGFYTPVISSAEKCTNCGLCLKVCSFSNELILNNEIKSSYASWSIDSEIRKKASSGGVAFELAKHGVSEGYQVCGVVYNNRKHRAEHRILDNENELFQTLGSKYIPSTTLPAFEQLVSKGNKNKKFIVFGTPCQIASLKLLIRKFKRDDNFILVDFFCHGVPSLKVWDRYIQSKGITKSENIKWRDKKNGWHDSWYIVGLDKDGHEDFRSQKVSEDEFFQFFLGHYALAPCCLNACKFKKYNSLADIRVGDLWGEKYNSNEKGINGVICFTEKGMKFMESMASIILKNEDVDIVSKGQMSTCASKPQGYLLIKMLLRYSNFSLNNILRIERFFILATVLPKRIIKKFISIFNL